MIAEFKGKYLHVFSDVPGPILNFEVSLRLSEGAQPVFRGTRVIAIRLHEKTKAAPDLMEKSELIENLRENTYMSLVMFQVLF